MHSSRKWILAAVLAAALPSGGCLFRSHRVEQPVLPDVLQSATRDELVARVNAQAAQIHTLNATVDIATSVGGVKKGKVTEYAEVRGYVLVRQPAAIRLIGLFPLVRNTAFDMVSDGDTYRLWLPSKNTFYTGHNAIIRPSKQPLESIRPQHILNALLLHAIDPASEIAVLEDTTQTVVDSRSHKPVEIPDYTLLVLQRNGDAGWYLARKLVFSRADLFVHRQIIYDKLGKVTTDASYEDFQPYNGTVFPASITIRRPEEEYTLTLSMVKLILNQPLKDEQFTLKQPDGARLIDLDQPPQNAAQPASPPAK